MRKQTMQVLEEGICLFEGPDYACCVSGLLPIR